MPKSQNATEVSVEDTKTMDEIENVTNDHKGKKKKTYKLHLFKPEDGRNAPKNGGSYKSITAAGAARKSANRWVIPKDEFDKIRTFYIREVGAPKEKAIFEFSAKRVKLKTPKTYKRGEKTITVNSKIEIVSNKKTNGN